MVATFQLFSGASSLLINESKSSMYYWHPSGDVRPQWTQGFKWEWANGQDVSKLLGAPFGIDSDNFLRAKLEKKLTYWVTVKLNLAGREIIANSVLVSTLFYFLAIWGGTVDGIKCITGMIRNFYWAGSIHRARA
jgi:hypothetical protein